jgi:threonylcarbamoyladenosine tRNA methylthiotransferase MtaB
LRRDRAGRLRAAGRASAAAFFAAQQGCAISVLMERDDCGHSEHFAPVRLAAPAPPGQVVPARVVGVGPDGLIAEAA